MRTIALMLFPLRGLGQLGRALLCLDGSLNSPASILQIMLARGGGEEECKHYYKYRGASMSEEVAGKAKGGFARAGVLSPQKRSEIAKNAAAARWGGADQLARATHEGPMRLGNVEISAAVLADGRRLITQSDFMRALGRARQAKGRQYYDGDVNLPAFLTAKNLRRFIPKDLEVTSSQIEFVTLRGAKAFGYAAELLPKVCEVFLQASDEGQLTVSQKHIADQAKILIRLRSGSE
jgi:hypothetical protein